jgi:hypothetical protein
MQIFFENVILPDLDPYPELPFLIQIRDQIRMVQFVADNIENVLSCYYVHLHY